MSFTPVVFTIEDGNFSVLVRTTNIGTDVPGWALRGLAADIAGSVEGVVREGRKVFIMNHTPTAEQTASLPEMSVCIAGEPVLVYWLAHYIHARGFTPLVACSERRVVETVKADGTVEKVSTFAHAGWRKFFDAV